MSARSLALAVVRDVFAPPPQQHNAQASLSYRLGKERLDDRDRAFATELCYGAIKMRRLLDWYLRPYVGDRKKSLPPAIAEILRLAANELVLMRSAHHAVVSEYVGLAKRYGHRGTAGLVNAVLRAFLRDAPAAPLREAFDDEDEFFGTLHSFPTWVVKHWRKRFGSPSLESILQAVNAPPQSAITVNRERSSIPETLERFRADGARAQPSDFVEDTLVMGDASYAAAQERRSPERYAVHGESAAMPVDVLNPQPAQSVLDVCSGRGNKALQERWRIGDAGTLTCVEKDARKAGVLAKRFEEAQIAAAVVQTDAAQPFAAGRFERVAVDAPCSGTGTFGRHPEARWRKAPGDAERLAPLQRALLAQAATHVHPGGVLVYAVCSTDKAEAEDVVEDFLRDSRFVRGLLPARYVPFQTAAGDIVVPPGLAGRDGFFIARLEAPA